MSEKSGVGVMSGRALTGVLHGRRSRQPTGTRPAPVAPLTLSGWLLAVVRAAWVVMAAGAVIVWFVEVPSYYNAALHLRNTSGTLNLSAGEWTAGLRALGLTPTAYAVWSIVTLSLVAGSTYGAGLLIFLRRSSERIALLVSFMFVTFGVGILGGYGGNDAIENFPVLAGPLSLYLAIANSSYYLLFLIPLVFPDGRFVPRWTGVLACMFAVLGVAGLVAPGSAFDMHVWPSWLGGLSMLMVGGTVLLSPIYRYWCVSEVTQRQQTKWVVFGLVSALAIFLSVGILTTAVPWFGDTPPRAVFFELCASTVVFVALSLLPVSFTVAILRFRLWDIDLVLNRTVVYAVLTVSVVAIYILAVFGAGSIIRAEGSPIVSLLATALVAILFHPLHTHLQRVVNRLLYGERDDPYAVISRLGRQLEAAPAPDSVLPSVVTTVARALNLPYASIALGHGEDLAVAASVGRSSDNLVHLPLQYQGETVGALTLGTRPGEAELSPADWRLLVDLSRQAGAASYAVRVTADLRRSRERLVTAREEERRRLRRDLHDGLGPSLASVILMADAARNLLKRDPAAAEALLADVKVEAQKATAEVRRVVYELRPPALDELGLVPALQALAAQYARSGLRVSIESPKQFPPLSAAVEVAAYRIAQESVTNVVRHAGARTCVVSIRCGSDLEIEIADDGRGFDHGRHGVGFTSMQERAEELGGSWTVSSRPGHGTRVTARLPLGEGSA